jgi:hypothetical protein
MKRLEPLISETGLLKLLQDGIDKGHWRAEHLDKPSNGFQICNEDAVRAGIPPKVWTNPLTGEVFDAPTQTEDESYRF